MAKKDFLDTILEDVENEYAYNADEVNPAESGSYIDTGCYILNALISGSLYGGMLSNKLTVVAGKEAVGKSFIGLSVIKKFLDDNPEGYCVYFETEGAITNTTLDEKGIDKKRVQIRPVATVESFRTQAKKILASYKSISEKKRPPLIFVLDSLGMLSTQKEVEDVEAGSPKRDMTRAPLIRGTFRVLTLECGVLNVPIFLTNHTYETIGSFITVNEMTGGGGIKYSASTILFLNKRQVKDSSGVYGNEIVVKLKKGRLTKENSTATMLLTYDKGLDRYYGLQHLGHKYDIIKMVGKSNPKITFPNGKTATWNTIEKNPEDYFDEDCMKQLEEVALKEFSYGSKLNLETESGDNGTSTEPTKSSKSKAKKKRGRPKKK